MGLLIGGRGMDNQVKNESSNAGDRGAQSIPHQNGLGNDGADTVNFIPGQYNTQGTPYGE